MPINPDTIRKLAFAIFFLLIALLFIGGHQPASGHLFTAPWDKVAHFTFYSVLTILIRLAFPKLSLVSVFLIAFGLSCLDEVHQILVPERHPEFSDLLADFIGILITSLYIPTLQKFIFMPKV